MVGVEGGVRRGWHRKILQAIFFTETFSNQSEP